MDADGTTSPVNVAPGRAGWLSAWPDALAAAAALALAWLLHWQVRDLVWSLWLSSLLVGYAMIVWRIFGPVVAMRSAAAGTPAAAPLALYFVGGLFLLAFFTFHFGMFHFVHSVFVNLFFPVSEGHARGFMAPGIYLQVFRAYWPFVLVAAVAERQAFGRPTALLLGPNLASANASTAKPQAVRDSMMEPYKNVVRMHLLIFFFAFAHFARLENYLVYAVVYLVYFFPWRLIRRGKVEAAGTAS